MADQDDDGRLRCEPIRSFGRRRGRRLRDRQSALLQERLPELKVDLSQPPPLELKELFSGNVDKVWLEIGFGGGEHLIWQAHANPDVGIIGCEPYIDGVAKVVTAVASSGTQNIRVHDDDARQLITWLPAQSIERIFVLFPDPWPKKKHNKRRLVSAQLLADLARVACAGAVLRLATDIDDYARVMLQAVDAEGSFRWTARRARDWRERPGDWPGTKYEAKARREGRPCYFLEFTKTA